MLLPGFAAEFCSKSGTIYLSQLIELGAALGTAAVLGAGQAAVGAMMATDTGAEMIDKAKAAALDRIGEPVVDKASLSSVFPLFAIFSQCS